MKAKITAKNPTSIYLVLSTRKCRVCGHTHERIRGKIIHVDKKDGLRIDANKDRGEQFLELSVEKDFAIQSRPQFEGLALPIYTVPVACPECGVVFLNDGFLNTTVTTVRKRADIPQWWIDSLPSPWKKKLGW